MALRTIVNHFFFASSRRHTSSKRDWSSAVCSSDLELPVDHPGEDVAPHRQPEYRIGELDVADLLVVEVAHGQLHGAVSSAAASGSTPGPASLSVSPPASSSAAPSPRNAAG